MSDFADDLDESEEPDPEDADWNLDPEVVACPLCGKEISEESEYCPHCDNYVVKDTWRRKPLWLVATAIALVVVILVAWVKLGW